jgi:hypothetical protein
MTQLLCFDSKQLRKIWFCFFSIIQGGMKSIIIWQTNSKILFNSNLANYLKQFDD